jgi:integrase
MPTSKEWIEAFHLDWLDRGAGNSDTWKREYAAMFKRLPQDQELNAQTLHAVVIGTTPNSRQRVRACVVITALARFAKIDYSASRYRGKYSFDNPDKPRELPTDDAIVAFYSRMENPKWRWVFAMMATYGLRNHEVFFVDLERLRRGDPVIKVLEGKTGPREVWLFYPEWFYDLDCYRPLLPNVGENRSHIQLGGTVSKYFREPRKGRELLPFNPYDLRHRFAVRTLECGLKTTFAARQMGHRLDVHNRIYHQWISRHVQDQAYEEFLKNPNRPQAPKIPLSTTQSGI